MGKKEYLLLLCYKRTAQINSAKVCIYIHIITFTDEDDDDDDEDNEQ